MNDPIIRLTSSSQPLETIDADWLVLGYWEDAAPSPALRALDEKLGGFIGRLRSANDFQAKTNELLPLHQPLGIKAKRILLLGLGKSNEAGRRLLHDTASTAVRALTLKKIGRVAIALPASDRVTAEQMVLAVGVGAIQGSHGLGVRRSEPLRFPPDEIILAGPAAESAISRATIEGEAVAFARRLVNLPPCDLYPETYAAVIADMALETGLECEIWDERRLAAERMGAILGIAQGSARPARFAVLRHRGSGSRTLALVGKGVTFDSGGLSLKTNDQMLDMKCDMAGAAAVTGAMQAIARLKLPASVIGIMPLVENMPSGLSVKLGDVLTSRSGKTIEILNTDAEGRVILADALTYAVEQKVSHIVDLATLTGAVMIALGADIAGLMTNNDEWGGHVRKAVLSAGERAWQLPMDSDFDQAVKSQVADLKNHPGIRYGGAITGAKFLEQFVAGVPWVHLDIAGPAWAEKDSSWRDAGGTGAYVRSLIQLAIDYR